LIDEQTLLLRKTLLATKLTCKSEDYRISCDLDS